MFAFDANVEYEDHQFGAKIEHNGKQFKTQELQAQFRVMKGTDMHLAADMAKKEAKWGGMMDIKCHNLKLGDELTYSWHEENKDNKWLFKMPLSYLAALEYKPKDGVTAKMGWEVNENYRAHGQYAYEVNDNLEVQLNYHYLCDRINESDGPHRMGMEFSYNL